MDKNYISITLLLALALTASCGNTGKAGDSDKTVKAPTGTTRQHETAGKQDGDACIDYDRILYAIVDGDTMEVNTYDDKGRLIVHRYQNEGEEGGDMYWCKDINTYDDKGRLIKTNSRKGECDYTTIYEYDDKGRLIRKKNNAGIDIHYTWNGLTRSDDAFCRSVITYSDNTYRQVIHEKSYVSGNGPIAHETIYDKYGRTLEYKTYSNGKLTSVTRHEYKDNVETETSIDYNEDGTEKSSEVTSKTEYLPNGKYNKILRFHIFKDGKENEEYEHVYDSENRLIMNELTEFSYNGTIVTQVDRHNGTKTVICYMKK